MKENKKNIFWGIVLILVAVYVLLDQMGVFSLSISIVSLIFSIAFLAMAIKGIIKLDFYQFLIPLAIIYWINQDMIPADWPISKISGWTMFLIALLLAIGLSMIFKNCKKGNQTFIFENEYIGGSDGEGCVESNKKGTVKISNKFTSSTKYINADNFKRANIDNACGKLVVHFNNAIMDKGVAEVNVDNACGETCLYIPNTWRIDLSQDSFFGKIDVNGYPNADAEAPLLTLNIDNAFGHTTIYYV